MTTHCRESREHAGKERETGDERGAGARVGVRREARADSEATHAPVRRDDALFADVGLVLKAEEVRDNAALAQAHLHG